MQRSHVMISSFLIESEIGLTLITSKLVNDETGTPTTKVLRNYHKNTCYVFYIDYMVAKVHGERLATQ